MNGQVFDNSYVEDNTDQFTENYKYWLKLICIKLIIMVRQLLIIFFSFNQCRSLWKYQGSLAFRIVVNSKHYLIKLLSLNRIKKFCNLLKEYFSKILVLKKQKGVQEVQWFFSLSIILISNVLIYSPWKLSFLKILYRVYLTEILRWFFDTLGSNFSLQHLFLQNVS